MKRTFFITGTNTGAGKTVLTALLARFLREQKIKVAAFKPICSGGRDDALILRAALGETLALDEINPWHFRAPIAPSLAAKREKKSVRLAAVHAHIRKTAKPFDFILVEGAGGLLSPLGEKFNSRDLISILRAAPVVVAPNQLGVVNQVLLTLAALPKNLRAKTKVILMSPVRPDIATLSNSKLLAQFMPPENIFILPWLGEKIEWAKVLKKPKVRQTLAQFFERSGAGALVARNDSRHG